MKRKLSGMALALSEAEDEAVHQATATAYEAAALSADALSDDPGTRLAAYNGMLNGYCACSDTIANFDARRLDWRELRNTLDVINEWIAEERSFLSTHPKYPRTVLHVYMSAAHRIRALIRRAEKERKKQFELAL